MAKVRDSMMRIGGAFALAALVGAPATAAAQTHKKHATHGVELAGDMIGSFTPAAGDPKLSGSFGRLGALNDGFRFTPSATPGSRRAVTVAVRARATTKADAVRIASIAATAPTLGIAPSAYSLGAAIGWKRFAVAGDLSRYDAGLLPGSRESADVALSYGGRSWSTRLALAGERTIDTNRLIGSEQSVALDLAGSYTLAHNLDVTGGVRYKIQRDQLDIVDERRDSQSVYIGTAFRF